MKATAGLRDVFLMFTLVGEKRKREEGKGGREEGKEGGRQRGREGGKEEQDKDQSERKLKKLRPPSYPAVLLPRMIPYLKRISLQMYTEFS